MTSPIQTIATSDAPVPFGHYVQATVHNGVIYVSGQLPAFSDGTHGFNDSFETQAKRCLENALAIVRAAGGRTDTVLRVTAYIVGVENWPGFNDLFAEIFGTWRPARAVVPVPELHHGYQIEVEIIASVADA